MCKIKRYDYNCIIESDVSPKEIFSLLGRVSEWWGKDFEGNSQNLGDIFTVRFGKEHLTTFKIIEHITDKKCVWLVTDSYLPWLKNKTEWTDTKVVWKISEENNSTKINFTHIGLEPQIECYQTCIKGWDYYLKHSLFKLLSEGKGFPD